MRERAHVYFMGGPSDLTKKVVEIAPDQWSISINEILPLTCESVFDGGRLIDMKASMRQHRYELIKLSMPNKAGNLPLYAAVWQESRP